MNPRVALTIAGSDSGGGAGIQADLRAFAAHRVFGTVAITAVTAQNTTGVSAVVALEPAMVDAQLAAVLSDLPVGAVKTGMLANPEVVAAVARWAQRGDLPRLVVDPVLVSTSGDALMADGGVEAYRTELLPSALVATPNLSEAAVLTGRPLTGLSTVASMVEAAQEIRALGVTVVVVKGGHLDRFARKEELRGSGLGGSPDVMVGPGGVEILEGGRVATTNDHGTGCTLSAAITARLALGESVEDAVRGAKALVARALAGAAGWTLGAGRGPVDVLGWDTPAHGGSPGAP